MKDDSGNIESNQLLHVWLVDLLLYLKLELKGFFLDKNSL